MGMDSDFVTGPQPPPTEGAESVSVTDQVVDDLCVRREGGVLKYGTELKTNNGRCGLVDAYQEALDLVLYLRKEIMEKHGV